MLQLPEEFQQDKVQLISAIDEMCYPDAFLVKFENVVESSPDKIGDPEKGTDFVVRSYDYYDVYKSTEAFKEYLMYLLKYYQSPNTTPGADDYGSFSSMSYDFYDENNHLIRYTFNDFTSLLGYSSMVLAYDKSANFRDFIH